MLIKKQPELYPKDVAIKLSNDHVVKIPWSSGALRLDSVQISHSHYIQEG